MTTFLILLIVWFGLGVMGRTVLIFEDEESCGTHFVALLIRAGLIVWASILLGMN